MNKSYIKIITWNLAGWHRKFDAQSKILDELKADIYCLQELNITGLKKAKNFFLSKGFQYFHSTLVEESNKKTKGNLTVSKYPLYELENPVELPFPRSLAISEIDVNEKKNVIFNLHIPNESNHKEKKTYTFEAVFSEIRKNYYDRPSVITGDFNAPQKELDCGRIIPFGMGQNTKGQFYTKRGKQRRVRSELLLFVHLRRIGFYDVYREIHGDSHDVYSYMKIGKETVKRNRFDHIISNIEFKDCKYILEPLLERLSDHCPLLGELKL